MSLKVKVLICLLATACSSNNVERSVSSTEGFRSSPEDMKEHVADSKRRVMKRKSRDYYNNRSSGGANFSYDGYKSEAGKFLGPLKSKANRKFTSEAGKRRQELFEKNLFDTGVDKSENSDCKKMMKKVHRTAQGECYFYNVKVADRDLHLAKQVMMGSLNQRFGRNIEKERSNAHSRQDLMSPNPLEISQKLLTRKDGKTKEAEIINVLAAAWLQSMNHDWFTHGKNSKARSHHVEGHSSHPHFKNGMTVPATQEESRSEKETASQGYDYNSEKLPVTGFHDNWWVGLDLVQSLFHMEHNRIIDKVLMPLKGTEICQSATKKECGDELFEKARMIVSALIAKIHTVEWTPALLDNPMLHIGMRGNWYGMREVAKLDIPWLRKRSPDFLKHLISGLMGKETLDLYGQPFSLTEEFVAVYRMHPLIPEYVTMRDHKNSKKTKDIPMAGMIFRSVPSLMKTDSSANWMHSFGTSHPGGLTLNNYPTFMQNFVAERNTGHTSDESNSTRMDMGAIDIIRDRERGVPKYNEFRRGINMPAIKSFEELTNNAEHLKDLKEIYQNDIEKLDLIVGTLAETDRYPGFAFGNTPFYIFAVMASRRLMADPFFSDYYTSEYYTTSGLEYVQNKDMIDVILNHYPELKSNFYKGNKRVVKNGFRPWLPVYDAVVKKITK